MQGIFSVEFDIRDNGEFLGIIFEYDEDTDTRCVYDMYACEDVKRLRAHISGYFKNDHMMIWIDENSKEITLRQALNRAVKNMNERQLVS